MTLTTRQQLQLAQDLRNQLKVRIADIQLHAAAGGGSGLLVHRLGLARELARVIALVEAKAFQKAKQVALRADQLDSTLFPDTFWRVFPR